jgi:N4-gp56 family major capsid protein
MAKTTYGVNDALAVKHWSRKLFQEVIAETYMGRFIGTGKSSLIHRKDETSKGAGDKVTVGLRMNLGGDGILGDSTLEGNEEALTTYSDSVLIDQLRHAVRIGGKMSEQRIPFNARMEAKDGLRDWWADRMDTAFFNHICGNTAVTDLRYSGNNAIVAPASGYHFWSEDGTSADEDLDATGDNMALSLVDDLVAEAKTASPIIRPIKVDGADKYVMFLHPYQVRDLRQDAATSGGWSDIQRAAMQGGQITDNPIYTGAIGEYNGVVFHESNRVTTGVNSSTGAAVANVRRAALCGAQAMHIAFGQGDGPNKMDWNEELFDYKNQFGVEAGCIYGLKKSVFNSKDFSTLVLSTYAASA